MIKKLFTFLICFALFVSPMRLYAASDDADSYISISYSPGERKLSVEGRDNISSGSTVIIYLVPGTDLPSSDENIPVVFDMVFAKDGGKYVCELVVPADTANGVYTVCVGNDARSTVYMEEIVIYDGNSKETQAALSAVNAAPSSESLAVVLADCGADLGIDMDSEIYPDEFAKVLYGVKKSEGKFTLDEFAEAVSYARGAVILKNTADVILVMRNYATAFDYTNTQYEELPLKLRTVADEIFVESDFNNGYVSYSDVVLTANAIIAESYGALKTVLIGNAEEYGIDTDGKYAGLSNNEKSTVFKIMFKEKDNYRTVEDIVSSFDEAVASLVPTKGNGSQGGSGSGGGKSQSSGTTVVSGLPLSDVSPVVTYTDISGSFAQSNIVHLSELGVVNGYADGSFKPQNPVTRAEFCKLVCVAFALEGSSVHRFIDVKSNDWFSGYVGVLSNLGIVQGDGTNFYPNRPITRQDAAVILGNTLKILGSYTEGNYMFSDVDQIAVYARPSVESLAAMGYFKGDGISFYPLSDITRAETAAVIDRIYTDLY